MSPTSENMLLGAKVQELFSKAGAPRQDNDSWGLKEFITDLLSNKSTAASIPVLTPSSIDSIPDGTLVYYRGMVQDMFNPEYYIGAYEDATGTWKTTKYSDHAGTDDVQQREHSFWERRPVYCVPVPHQAPWCTERLRNQHVELQPPTPSAPSRSKRFRDEDTDMEVEPPSATGPPSASTQACTSCDHTSSPQHKRLESEGATHRAAASGGAAAAGVLPAVEQCQGDCVVYLYDDAQVKVHEVVEVWGTVSRVPQLAQMHMEADGQDEFMAQHLSSHPPTSQVFRLHAMVIKKSESMVPPPAVPPTAYTPSEVSLLRGRALELLTGVLGGDAVAAEYLLLYLLSTKSTGYADGIGSLFLNIMGCPTPAEGAAANITTPPTVSPSPATPSTPSAPPTPGKTPSETASPPPIPAHPSSSTPPTPNRLSPFGSSLEVALRQLLPCTCGVQMSVASLNAAELAPRQDPVSCRLSRGQLQLPAGTVLVLDETMMQSGTLLEKGVNNLRVIQQLLQTQTLPISFNVYNHDVPTHHPLITLSTTRTLFKECAIPLHLPLAPSAPLATNPDTVEAACSQLQLDPVRDFLEAAKSIKVGLEAVADLAAKEFTDARQEDRGMGPETLHTWILVAKLLAASHGEKDVSVSRWANMKALEHRRQERLRAV